MAGSKIFFGFLTGIICTIIGMIIYLSFSELGISETISDSLEKDYFSKIISLGAILNFLPFFVFLKKNMLFQARGILLSTLVTAIVIAAFKFL